MPTWFNAGSYIYWFDPLPLVPQENRKSANEREGDFLRVNLHSTACKIIMQFSANYFDPRQ